MRVEGLDHLVLTVADIEATLRFYCTTLGMTPVVFEAEDGPRHAVAFGRQKINLHLAGQEFEPKADRPTPGSGDLCFLVSGTLDGWIGRLDGAGVAIIEGPVSRTGATGPLRSVYVRDPDGNLVELAVRA